jgi:hypothetical protein
VTRRLAVLALLGALAAGCGGSHKAPAPPADFAPRLQVEQRPALPGRPTTLTLDIAQDPSGPPLGTAEIDAPRGFRITVPATGSIGTAELFAGDAKASGSLAAAGAQCGGDAGLAADLGSSGTVAVAVQDAGTRLKVCAPKDVHHLRLRLDRGLVATAAGNLVWRGRFARSGQTVESRAVVPTPGFLTAEGTARAVGGRVVARVHGYLLQGGPQPNRIVRVLAGPSADRLTLAGRARTGANGGWSFTLRGAAAGRRLVVVARAQSVERPCAGTCSTTTVSGATSDPLVLVVQD